MKITDKKWARSKKFSLILVRTGILHQTFHLVVGSMDGMMDFFHHEFNFPEDKEKESTTEAFTFIGTTSAGLKQFFICFPSKKVKIGTIAHESFHLLWRILEHKGIKLGTDSEEIFSYGLEFIIEEVMDRLKTL